jgi:hypothetical protein
MISSGIEGKSAFAILSEFDYTNIQIICTQTKAYLVKELILILELQLDKANIFFGALNVKFGSLASLTFVGAGSGVPKH